MKTRDQRKWKIGSNIGLAVCAFLALMPFILLVIASFTDDATAIRDGYSYFPAKWSIEAYKYIAAEWKTLARAYLMTILVTLLGTAIGLTITTGVAYMLSKKDLPGRRILTFFVLFTMLFNGGLVATYIMYVRYFNIKDTIWALIVPNLLMNGFMVMLIKNYFENSIPQELYDAAKIDGASEFQLFFRVTLPLAKPILATVGLLMAVAYWNDWQNGLYYLNDTSLYTIQNILNDINENISFLASNATSGVALADLPTATVRMAIAVVGILPILIIYPFVQKFFAKGITMGAIKE